MVPGYMRRVKTESNTLDRQYAQFLKELFEIVLVLAGDRCMDNRFARGFPEVFYGAIKGPLPSYAVVDLPRAVEGQDPLSVERRGPLIAP